MRTIRATRSHTKKILDSALAAVAAAARAGEEVTLAGFGRFKVTERAERQGRNPATGETITIAASKKLTFVAAKNIRDAMNTAAAAAANRAPAPVGEHQKTRLSEPEAKPEDLGTQDSKARADRGLGLTYSPRCRVPSEPPRGAPRA